VTKRKLIVWLLVCCLHNLPTTSFSLRDANKYRWTNRFPGDCKTKYITYFREKHWKGCEEILLLH